MKTILAIPFFSACIVLSGCMSQQTATKQQSTHEFIAALPNHPKTELYDKVVKWIASSSQSAQTASELQDKDAGSIVRNGSTEIKPEGSIVKLPVGFTMNVDVRNERMRVRFTNLRRLFGSKKYEITSNDDFFKTATAIPYQEAAHATFAAIVQNLTDFIEQGRIGSEGVYTPLSNR